MVQMKPLREQGRCHAFAVRHNSFVRKAPLAHVVAHVVHVQRVSAKIRVPSSASYPSSMAKGSSTPFPTTFN